ncbi:CD225/dispanin family protein [Streptomyces diastatochromogenes]|uniref:CD225/dispanin family protein n=1 Tax=Streptomyces diastatochromogenes TaxID=42236 RepID=UPI00368EAB3E
MSEKHQPPPPDEEDWGPTTPWGVGAQPPPVPPIQPPPPGPQGWQTPYPRPTPTPQTYLVPAILVTLFCFLPTGIAAIVFSSQVSSKSSVGDFEGAAQASRKAGILIVVSLLAGLVFWAILIAIGMSTPSTTTQMPAP